MALPSTGAISMSQVRTELGRTGAISLNDVTVRTLAGIGSGAISMADLRGKSIPDTPGTPFGGGFYAGKILVGEQPYALIVSPKAQGESAPLQWKTSATATAGTSSRNDGWSNTLAMIQAGSAAHPAAAFCRGLNINGFNDWYLPSMDELEILYRVFKPSPISNTQGHGANPSSIPPTSSYTRDNPSQTNVTVFQQGGEEYFAPTSHWASTQITTEQGQAQVFGPGMQVAENKTYSRLVRAVRRVAIAG